MAWRQLLRPLRAAFRSRISNKQTGCSDWTCRVGVFSASAALMTTMSTGTPLSASDTSPQLGIKDLPPKVNNSGDELAVNRSNNAKLMWLFRHGQSTGNVAKSAAQAEDKARGDGKTTCEDVYVQDTANLDAPLTALGVEQAEETASKVALWVVQPTLVVVSPLTRSIQSAAIIFRGPLLEGRVRLVVRPELREYFPRLQEDRGRKIAELLACEKLQALPAWPCVKVALQEAAASSWSEHWDKEWAFGSSYEQHVNDPARASAAVAWLLEQPETEIATVSHWGTINNILNREPWSEGLQRTPVCRTWGPMAWPKGGLVKKFEMPNCGWIVAVSDSRALSATQ